MDNIDYDSEVLTFLVENYGDIVKIVLETRKSSINLILNTIDQKTIYINHFDEKNIEEKLIEEKLIGFFKKILAKQPSDVFSYENYSKGEGSYNDLFFKVISIPMYPSGSDVIIEFIPNEDGMFLKSQLIRKEREILSTIIKLDELENKSIKRM